MFHLIQYEQHPKVFLYFYKENNKLNAGWNIDRYLWNRKQGKNYGDDSDAREQCRKKVIVELSRCFFLCSIY
jgi:hypothetical protein